ncbi:T9SS type A sorting domain-containing protein [Hymenobacter monticola]|uniref:T9SS type A sorting domain-containing protein n=1 Tax=Hymenobacter monticola TaxID=1705399 RepID=A0ABY4BBV0_9BACT|nr:T9SS type A sorting domain-containing protein [Hymenobacter monticola]UOE35161.1 T9SS type A sorting domain-containing protein [Hymenobacter monticola]
MRKPLLFLLGLLGSGALAQAQQRDPSFHNATFQNGANVSILRRVVPQADGKYVVGGDFTAVDGHATRHVARILADGRPDVSFRCPQLGSGVSGLLAVQADGRALVWADSVRPLVRLLPSGDPDASFVLDTSAALGTRLRRAGATVFVQADGKLVVTGQQTLVRLNSDGSRDTGFQSPALSADMYVKAVSLEPTGGFTYVTSSPELNNRVTTGRISATGAPDASFVAQTLNRSDVNCLLRLADGRYLLGGIFDYGGSIPSLLRLLPNGTIDSSLQSYQMGYPVYTNFPTGPVTRLVEQADGLVLAAGTLNAANARGGPAPLVRCVASGQPDTTLNAHYISRFRTMPVINYTYNTARVIDMRVEASGKIIVAGLFEQVGGQPSSGLTRLLAAQPLASKSAHEAAVQLWPNPAREQLELRFEAAPPRRVALLEATGRTVLAVAGAPALTLRTAGLARGLYVLRLDYDGRTASQRVVLE